MKKFALLLACTLAVACGDDDTDRSDVSDTVPQADSGPRDSGTGTDAGDPVEMDGGRDVDMGNTMTSMCPAGACDLVTNAGCAAGEGCYYAAAEAGADPAPLCAPAGTLTTGAPCTDANSCQEGFICVGDPGVCRRICCNGNDADCMPGTTGELCIINLVDDAGESTGVGACLLPDDCDPVAQTGCAAGEACLLSGEGSVICAAGGPGMQGDSCEVDGCAGGFVCIGGDSGSTCVALCDRTVAEPTCDDATLTCNQLNGYDDVGVCVP